MGLTLFLLFGRVRDLCTLWSREMPVINSMHPTSALPAYTLLNPPSFGSSFLSLILYFFSLSFSILSSVCTAIHYYSALCYPASLSWLCNLPTPSPIVSVRPAFPNFGPLSDPVLNRSFPTSDHPPNPLYFISPSFRDRRTHRLHYLDFSRFTAHFLRALPPPLSQLVL